MLFHHRDGGGAGGNNLLAQQHQSLLRTTLRNDYYGGASNNDYYDRGMRGGYNRGYGMNGYSDDSGYAQQRRSHDPYYSSGYGNNMDGRYYY